MLAAPQTFTRNGFSYVVREDGRIFQIPAGGEGDTPPADPNPKGNGGTPPPSKVTWDQIDWDNGPQLTDSNFPKHIQDVFNRSLAKERREAERKIGEVQAQLREQGEKRAALEEQYATLSAGLEELRNPPPPDNGGDPLAPPPNIAKHPHLAEAWIESRKAQLAAEEARKAAEQQLADISKKFEGLTTEIQKERETRTKAETRNLELRRDREIAGVLARLRVFDPNRVLPLYATRTEYVADRDSFAYRNADGELVDLEAGIKGDLPDNFVLPDLANGGSGAHGALGGATASKPVTPADQRTKLSQERDALKAKREKGQRLSGNEQARLMAIGRELESLGPA